MLFLSLLSGCPVATSAKDTGEDTGDTSAATGDTDCAPQTWYADADGDGWGDDVATQSCDAPAGHVSVSGDCDDGEATVNPDAAETCDGVDEDCDGTVDEDLATGTAAPDADGDGYGDAAGVQDLCAVPDGWTTDASDCDDTSAAISPVQSEVCNGLDDDCDGLVDADDSPVYGLLHWYADTDGDGYGDADADTSACDAPAGYVADDTDCDDADGGVYPGAAEVCVDFVDQDCDGADDYSCLSSGEGGEVDLCDPSIVPADVTLCASGVAAVLASGATYSTVQDALDAAVVGDVVTVCPGTWSEDLTQRVSPLSVVGYGATSSILEGAGGTTLSMGTGQELTLVDLTVQGGSASDGAGLFGRDATLCVAGSTFTGNHATYSGGGMALSGTGTLQVEDSVFYDNRSDYEGGAIDAYTYTVTIEDTLFYGNWSGYEAGAMELDSTGTGTISDTEFTANEADYEAGALLYGGWGPALSLDLDTVTQRRILRCGHL